MSFIRKGIIFNCLIISIIGGLLISCGSQRNLNKEDMLTPSDSSSTASKLNVSVSANSPSVVDNNHPNSQFTITNTSNDTIVLNKITVSTDVSNYFMTDFSNCIGDSSSSLSPGQSCTINVFFKSFIAKDGKSHSYNFNLSYNDPLEKNIQSPTIIGQDEPEPSSPVNITASLNTLNSSNINSTYTIKNNSFQDIRLNKIVPSDSTYFTTDFSNCINSSSATLATGNSCKVVIKFINSTQPTGKSHNYNFELYYNNISKPVLAPSIIGNNDPIPPTARYFTAIPDLYTLDSSHTISTYTIKNNSNQDIQLNSITVPDNFNNYFKSDFSNCMNGSAWKILTHSDENQSNSCKVIVTFNTPTIEDGMSHQYYFSINYNDPQTFIQSETIIGNDNSIPVLTPTFAYVTNLNLNQIVNGSSGSSAVSKCTVLSDGSYSDCKDPGGIGFNSSTNIFINNNYAYIVNNSANSILKCTVMKDGSFSNCKDSGGLGFNWPESIFINNNYAYVTNGNLSYPTPSAYYVSKCSLSNDGSLYNCLDAGSPNFDSGSGKSVSNIFIKNKFVYITYSTHDMNNEIWQCSISNFGYFSNCKNMNFPDIDLRGVFINNNYAYVLGNNLNLCLVSSNDGSFSNCKAISNPDARTGSISFNNDYAYLPLTFESGLSGGTTVLKCTILQDGSLSECIDSKGTGFNGPSSVFFTSP